MCITSYICITFIAAVSVSFSSDSYTVNEDAGNVMITLVTTDMELPTTNISVNVSVMDGTALSMHTGV